MRQLPVDKNMIFVNKLNIEDLVYHDFLSHDHFEQAVLTLAKKYPIGKLSVLSDNMQKHFILP